MFDSIFFILDRYLFFQTKRMQQILVSCEAPFRSNLPKTTTGPVRAIVWAGTKTYDFLVGPVVQNRFFLCSHDLEILLQGYLKGPAYRKNENYIFISRPN